MRMERFLRKVELPVDTDGQLWLSRMPGRNGSFADDVASIGAARIARVVRLASLEEVAEKSPDYRAAIASGNWHWPTVDLAIPDYDVPDDPESFTIVARDTAGQLKRGESVLVHCAAGRGRSGMFAIAVLCALGVAPELARRVVSDAGAGPETERQRTFVTEIAERLAARG